MAEPGTLAAEVLITSEVSAEQEHALVEAFQAVGVAARARMVPTRRGVEEFQWLVLAALPLHAFLSGLGSALAEEASQGIKRLVSRVLGDRRTTASPAPVLVLQDSATRLQVVLEADLPTDAYNALLSLDLATFQRGPLHYDRHAGRWRSELDEGQST
jgi:hypothetical protein